ncbi:MAG: 4-hydroxy-tetrahydrodipicolinate synthase [Acidiferrobacterales bacterium]
MFQGSMVALVTPMRGDGSLDIPALHRLIDFHIDNGTNAIIAVGTTGESATVNVDEHCEILRQTVKHVNGRIPVIAGTGANATAEAIELTRYAHEARADACLLVTPYYNKPTQEGLYLHYKAIAEAVPIPQILYNVPGRTACDMLPETVIRLASVPNIVGIKEATGKIERVKQIVDACSDSMEVYSGDDATALDLMLAGGRGVISVTANVAPRQMSDMCAAALRADESTARTLDERLMDLHKGLFVESNPIPVKWALKEMGLIEGGIRLPLTPLASKYHATVRQALRKAGTLD